MTTEPTDVPPVRVVIADDQPMIRLGLTMILDNEPDIITVGEAADGQQALDLVRTTSTDVVLLDIRMPGVDGIEATRRIRADPSLEAVRVVVLTTFDDEEYVTQALRAGADAFLLKDTDPATLIAAVHRVHAGGSLIDPAVTAMVLDQWRAWGADQPGGGPGGPSHDGLARLTPREREVLLAVARGGSNLEVAAELGITQTTVKAYVHELLTKLGCTGRSQLVVIAYESGLVVPGTTRTPGGVGQGGPGGA